MFGRDTADFKGFPGQEENELARALMIPGTLANRPAAAGWNKWRMYYATDTEELFWSDGVTWYAAGGGGNVSGTGTTNKVAKWTASDTIGDSQITDDGTTIQVVAAGALTLTGGANSAWTTPTAGTDTAGFTVSISSGASGPASAAVGKTGAALNITGGAGGAGSVTYGAGQGGTVTITGGASGANGGGGANAGGPVYIVGGTGGTVQGGIGISGGSVSISATSSLYAVSVAGTLHVNGPLAYSFRNLTISASGTLLIVDYPVILLHGGGTYDIQGMPAPSLTYPRTVILINKGAAGVLTIKNEDAAATAADRFKTFDGNDVELTPGAWAFTWYDGGTDSRWLVGPNSTSGGGFTNPMTTLGDIIYEDATPEPARLAGNTTTTKKKLTQTGTGAISAVPAWDEDRDQEAISRGWMRI